MKKDAKKKDVKEKKMRKKDEDKDFIVLLIVDN